MVSSSPARSLVGALPRRRALLALALVGSASLLGGCGDGSTPGEGAAGTGQGSGGSGAGGQSGSGKELLLVS
ncbi:MAG: hypothetical protein ACKO22_06980 [Cyanobium sp.]